MLLDATANRSPAGALVDAIARSAASALVNAAVCSAAGALLDAHTERCAAEQTVPDDQAPEAVMQTFRRLNDPERYYGLSWRGWISVALGGGVLYLAVRFSPIGTRPTITITVLALALAGTILQAVSGQALGPGRYLLALYRYTRERKQLTAPERPERSNLILDQAPALEPTPEPGASVELELEGALE